LPEGLWPSFGDPRVTAIIPMAGDAYLFDQAGLAKVTVPMLALGGTANSFSPYEWGPELSYDYAASAEKALVTFAGAEDLIFITPCENDPERRAWEPPVYSYVCLDPVWDKHRALDLIHHFSTAFLLDTLKGDPAAHAALLPDAVNFPGIEYSTTLH
jgi:predicted dienelactone hydrolase